MQTEQLEVFGIPYDLTFNDDCKTVTMESEYLANYLAVPPRYSDRYEGFWVNKENSRQFIDVRANDGIVEFNSRDPIDIDMLADWFRANLDAIFSIEYEVLVKEHA